MSVGLGASKNEKLHPYRMNFIGKSIYTSLLRFRFSGMGKTYAHMCV